MRSHRTSSTTHVSERLALLEWTAAVPLATVAELAALSRWNEASLARRLKNFRSDGLVDAVRLSTPGTPAVHRQFLTAAGIRALATAKGITVEHFLRTRPVSRQWLRLLLTRADTIASIYRVASWLAETTGVRAFRWYRSLPLDAAVLTGSGVVGVLREGPTAPPSQFRWRVECLLRRHEVGTVLVLAPDSLRLRQMRRTLDRTPISALLAVRHRFRRSYASVLYRAREVLGGDMDFVLALYERKTPGKPEEWPFVPASDDFVATHLTRTAGFPLSPPEARFRPFEYPRHVMPARNSQVRVGSAVEHVITTGRPLLLERVSGFDFWGYSDLTALSRPVYWYGRIAKVLLVVVRHRDRRMLEPQVLALQPDRVARSYQTI